MSEYMISGADILLPGAARDFSLPDTLDCGQAFRWREEPDGAWRGICGARSLRLAQTGEDIVLLDTGEADFLAYWREYFDLGRDYAELKRLLCADPVLAEAVRHSPGIRVLRQDGWEALCTFIVTQNNNIKRIKGIVEKLCESFGEPTEGGFAFPTAERLAALSEEDLAVLHCGYRSPYLIDCSRRVAEGRLDLGALRTLPLDEARRALLTVKGIGPKVADCALLFGFGRQECFPQDVWIKRAMAELFPEGLPDFALPVAGIAQQYIFHYMRTRDRIAAN